jgi:hypothetical protein
MSIDYTSFFIPVGCQLLFPLQLFFVVVYVSLCSNGSAQHFPDWTPPGTLTICANHSAINLPIMFYHCNTLFFMVLHLMFRAEPRTTRQVIF